MSDNNIKPIATNEDVQKWLEADYKGQGLAVTVDLSEIGEDSFIDTESNYKAYFNREYIYKMVYEDNLVETNIVAESGNIPSATSNVASTDTAATGTSTFNPATFLAYDTLDKFTDALVRLEKSELSQLSVYVQKTLGKNSLVDYAKEKYGLVDNDGVTVYINNLINSSYASQNPRANGTLDYTSIISSLYDAINSIDTDEEKINQILCDTTLTQTEIAEIKNRYFDKFGISLSAHLLKTYNSNWDKHNIVFYESLLNVSDDTNKAEYEETNESALLGGFASNMIITTTIDGYTVTCKFDVPIFFTPSSKDGKKLDLDVKELKISASTDEINITDKNTKIAFCKAMQQHDTEAISELLNIIKTK